MVSPMKLVNVMKLYTSSPSTAIHQAKRFNKRSGSTSRGGFTMIEVVVMLGIVTMISTVVLVSFTGLNEGGAMQRAGRELALAIRRAQNMSLAVTQVETSTGPQIPPAVGIKLDRTNPSGYFLFADMVRDNKYTPDDAKIGQDEAFPVGVRVSSLTDSSGASYTFIHLLFAAPEAVVTITDTNGVSVGDKIDIELSSPSGQKKKVVMRTSGQVSIK